MAYATQDQILNYLQDDQKDKVDPTSSQSMGGGASGIVSGATGGAQPQGQGGQGLWTNIQSYMNANQAGQAERAKNVEQQVKGTFGEEKQGFEKASSQAKESANKAAEPISSLGTDKASQLINQASSAEKGSEKYNQAVNPVKQAVNTQYQVPQQFSYGMSSAAQEAGKGVKEQGAFQNFLSQFDKNLQGGRDLNVGQRALQNQLDVNNTALEQARQNLANEYSGLQSQESSGLEDVNKYLTGLGESTTQQQSALRKFLEGQSGDTRKALEGAVSSHNQDVTAAAKNYQNYLNKLNSLEQTAQQGWTNWSGDAAKFLSGLSREELGKIKPVTDFSGDVNKLSKADKANVLYGSGFSQKLANTPENAARIKHQKAVQDYITAIQQTPEYQAGQMADINSIGGVGSLKGKYNTLMDIFGQQGLQAAPEAKNAIYTDKKKWGI